MTIGTLNSLQHNSLDIKQIVKAKERMTIMEPTDGGSSSKNLICPRCRALLSPQALFCSSCGLQITRKQNEAGEAGPENGGNDAQGQEVDATVRIPLLSRTQMRGLESYRSLNNNARAVPTYTTRSRSQDEVAGPFEELTAPLIPVPAKELTVPSAPVPIESLSKTWGWLPVLSLTSALGVFLVALAYEMGRIVASWGGVLFWFGLLALSLPITWRLFSLKPARQERIALLIVLGSALYFVKFLQYPLYFTYFDEFTHWRTTLNIIASGHLFHENPLLAISSWYPGLEIVTSALSSLTGLSIFTSGILLIGLARLVFVLALYLFYEQLTNSSRVAGIAGALYMANPNFLFFDADFSYESFALPLAVFVLFTVALRCYGPAGRHRGLILAICFGLGAVVVTHHLTSFVLVAFLLLWTVVFLLLRTVASFYQSRTQKDSARRPSPAGAALLGLVLVVAWLTYTANRAAGYLGQYISKSEQQLVQILAGETASRHLFQNTSGFGVPLWERIIASTSVALILLGLLPGLLRIWQRHRANAVALVLAGGALAYPVGQALRLIPSGAEAGARTTEFTFVGVVFVLAIGATEFWFSRTSSWRRSAVIMGAVGIIFFGQMILSTGAGGAPLPGPYVAGADAGSIEPESITAAEWAGSYLGPGHRTASDRTNWLLLATYGYEQIVKAGSGTRPVTKVFTSVGFGQTVVAILQQDKIQYLVVDRRLSPGLPVVGNYFDLPATGPIDPAALAKFDHVENVSRIFDSGDIQIYDVEAITNEQSATSTPKPLCTPRSPAAVSSSYPKVGKLYTGTLDNIPMGLTAKISLTGIQQQQGSICGYFSGMPTKAPSNGIPGNSSFKGTITTDGHIQFIVGSNTRQVSFSFNGLLLSDGSISGTYCNSGITVGQCSVYGLWSVSPAKPE